MKSRACVEVRMWGDSRKDEMSKMKKVREEVRLIWKVRCLEH